MGVRSLIGQRIIMIPLIFATVVICGQFDWSLCQARRGGVLGLQVERWAWFGTGSRGNGRVMFLSPCNNRVVCLSCQVKGWLRRDRSLPLWGRVLPLWQRDNVTLVFIKGRYVTCHRNETISYSEGIFLIHGKHWCLCHRLINSSSPQ